MYRLMYYTTPIPLSRSSIEQKKESEDHAKSESKVVILQPSNSTELSPTTISTIHSLTLKQVQRLTTRQRDILKRTFGPMDRDAVPNGLKMLIMLFSEFPRYKQIWPQFRAIPDSSLMDAIELKRHASVYMTGLGAIIHSMDDPEKLERQLTRIARAHIKWNIHRSHITHMLQPVLEIVTSCNGGKTDSEICAAWTALYNVIADLIEIYRAQEKGQDIRCL